MLQWPWLAVSHALLGSLLQGWDPHGQLSGHEKVTSK